MKTELDKLIKDMERLKRKNKALRQEVKLLKQRIKEASDTSMRSLLKYTQP